MSRSKGVLQFQGPTTPQPIKITLKKLGEIDLQFSVTQKRKLRDDELLEVITFLKKETEYKEHTSKRASSKDAEKVTSDMINTAKRLVNDIQNYRDLDDKGTVTSNNLALSIGVETSKLTAALRPIRAIARASAVDLLGTATKQKPEDARNRLALKFLALFEKAGGVSTKTKSAKGDRSSLAASWLVDLGKAIIEDHPELADLVLETDPSAETFVAHHLANASHKES